MSNPAGLSARELEVLSLAEGLRKLDAGTRGEAGAQTARLGLTRRVARLSRRR
jgi:hypothetical protein